MSSTKISNEKRGRASSTSSYPEESTATTIAIRPRTSVTEVVSVASSGFESLVDDTLDLVRQFLGKRSYHSYGAINKRCRMVFLSKNLPKETYFYGYAPLSMIKERIYYTPKNESLSLAVVALKDKPLGQAVVAYNRYDILQWLLLEKNKRAIVKIFDIAASYGLITLKRVKNLVGDDAFTTMKIYEDWHVCQSAARSGKLDALNWLKSKGWFDPLDSEGCMSGAASGGSLETIHWFLRNGCTFDDVDEEVICCAARQGHLHVINFFIENGFSINGIGWKVSIAAAEGGHLHILKWLHENNRSFNHLTFAYAARNGKIDNLQWLLEISCPWDKKCYEKAAFSDKLEVLEWLKEKGCPRGNSKLQGILKPFSKLDVILKLRNDDSEVKHGYVKTALLQHTEDGNSS